MQRIMGGAAAAAVICAGTAYAGGVERSALSSGILFEEGTYVQLTYGYVSPDVSGTQASALGPFVVGAPTGDVTKGYISPTLEIKTALSEKLDMALILDQPIGARVDYANPAYLYGAITGSHAEITSSAITALVRYKLPSNFSVYGGLRNEQAQGQVLLFTQYALSTQAASDWGYILGAAWEKPEIAMRFALTYSSAITHNFAATENDPLFAVTNAATTFETVVPQSVNFEFQTGVAADTLLFGNIRWADWTAFDITPVNYEADYGGALVSYDNDSITYNIGIGRRFSETWSGAVTAGYEAAQGGFAGNLGPTDGYTSLGLAASYTRGNITVTGGARYIWVGDAKTESPLVPGATQGDFTDNSGVAVGLQIGYQF